jgi:hypothetical protein
VEFIECINIFDVHVNPFELLDDFITLSMESFFLNIHCISVGSGFAMRLTVMFNEVPFCRPITSDELGVSTFKRGSTETNKNIKSLDFSFLYIPYSNLKDSLKQ